MIVVAGFEVITEFREFALIKKCASHSFCTFTVAKEKYGLSDSIFETKMKVFDGCPWPVMTGMPLQIRYHYGYSENLMQFTIASQSKRLDEGRHTRIFQNTEKTYRDILNKIAESGGFELVFAEEGLGEETISQAVVQLDETDLEFIRRIAEQLDTCVWIDDKSDGIFQIRFGDSRNSFAVRIREESLLVQEIEATAAQEDMRFQIEAGNPVVWCLDIGKKVCIDGSEYVICELAINKVSQVYQYEYTATRKKENQIQHAGSSDRKPLHSFLGRVINNQDAEHMGRVQVDFASEDVTDISDGKNIWIDVATIYDGNQGGVVFLPDRDDFVDVLWDGRSFLVTGTRRTEKLARDHRNVEEKCIVDRSGRKICFAENALKISSDKSSLLLHADQMEITTGRQGESQIELTKDIKVHSAGISMEAEQKLTCAAKKAISLESSHIKAAAQGKAVISGRTVEIN